MDESGRVHAEMDLARASSGQSVVEWAADLQARGDRICERLVVQCEHGEYSAIGAIVTGTTMWIVGRPSASAQLRFSPVQSEFASAGPGEAVYWILPLLNFLGDFVASGPALNRHPLRLRQVQDIPPGLDPEDQARAQLYLSQESPVIPFEFAARPAFIEPLLDYADRQARLRTGNAPCLVTSLMVGEVGGRSPELANIADWFPFDFQWVLSLATANEVGFPWLEIRDARGQILRCLHLSAPPTVAIANVARPGIPTGHEMARRPALQRGSRPYPGSSDGAHADRGSIV